MKLLFIVLIMDLYHDSYITRAIEGILLQKTSFDFEFIIGEDHSSDNI
jgi:hypothetical protein